MARGTTMTTAGRFMRASKRARSATSGNKNVTSRANRQGRPMSERLTSPITGPDRGVG